ncbi:DoxX family protein [Fulvivirgaceae bacterium BMA10]|uniref:DoxX family protein n=1 Tax=Splendidivirga corallicola TaxID=3051826 RepID=A0ABT8KQ57_9BACT|nr:DoxX family protein [Fulvivirgaceae bacterium BMA10]
MSKRNKIIGWILTGLASAVLLFSSFGKFFMPAMAENMNRYGLKDWTMIIGAGELISTILFILPENK